MKIGTKISKVESLLQSKPHLKDNDNLLLANIWESELKEMDIDPAKVSVFLALYGLGHLSNAESIRRCRQKLQQENPELRGNNYKGRQISSDKVKDELKNWEQK